MSSDPMKRSEQNSIRVWFRTVMREKEWSANQWASLAGTSASNITRFLKDGNFTPSSATLAKLAYVAGSQPAFHTSSDHTLTKTQQVTLFDELDNEINRIGVFGVSGELKAYLSNFVYTPLGIKPSDTIVVKTKCKILDGKFLCITDGVINLVLESTNDDKFLIDKSTGDIIKRKDCNIVGRIVQIVKNLDYPEN